MRNFDCLERPLSQLFYRYGRFIAFNPLPLIFFPLFITIFAISGFISLNSITDAIYLFTPANAQSKTERQIIHDKWPLFNGSYIPGRAVTQSREIQVTVSTKELGENILTMPYSDMVVALDKQIQQDVKVEYKGRKFGYKDLCLSGRNHVCPGNKHIGLLSGFFQHGVNMTYPMIKLGGVHHYIGASLGGVTVGYGQNNEMILRGAHSWLMIYHLQFFPPNVSHLSGLWEKQFQLLMQNYSNPFITVTYFHSQTLAEELKRNADSLKPRFILAFVILLFFSALCNMSTCRKSWYIDWAVSKPVLAILGVINAGMGIVTAIGYLNLCSMPYNDIVGVMPFLVVAVGVDNMFLMIAAIRRTNRASSVQRRMGEAMSDAAISMFITALTDALSFGVGAITSIPAVQIFCIYTGVAIAVTFIYQITFFAGLLALSIHWESNGLHCIFLRPTVPEDMDAQSSLMTRLFWLGTAHDPDPKKLELNLRDSKPAHFFQNWFAPILMQPLIRGLAIVWFGVYLIFAIYGCTQLREGLEPINLLVRDSYAIPHYRVLEKYFWHYGAIVQVVVNNAPNLGDPEERQRIRSMVHAFANTRHTIGDESVQFWMKEMEWYYSDPKHGIAGEGFDMSNVTSDETFYGLAKHFFSAKHTENWPEDIKWGWLPEKGFHRINSFRFLVGLRDISTSVQQQTATQLLRDVAARFPRYNITTFMPLWLFTDQYALVVPNTIQNIVIAMAVMVFIALLLIPQPSCAFWVALAIASIDIGVIGFMTLWSVNLDAISMITIIMSIGFSVDYSAHITYGYVCSTRSTPREKIREALGALGWPLTQGAISTILAVVVLADVPAYMIVTFFKTVFLAITLGLLHGLVFLPVALVLFVRGCCTGNTHVIEIN
uniref:SSD domain-containing protein n=1 Tax=Meloidogyne incognita TaxID=6306 RepID=A0A914N234_MELIC